MSSPPTTVHSQKEKENLATIQMVRRIHLHNGVLKPLTPGERMAIIGQNERKANKGNARGIMVPIIGRGPRILYERVSAANQKIVQKILPKICTLHSFGKPSVFISGAKFPEDAGFSSDTDSVDDHDFAMYILKARTIGLNVTFSLKFYLKELRKLTPTFQDQIVFRKDILPICLPSAVNPLFLIQG